MEKRLSQLIIGLALIFVVGVFSGFVPPAIPLVFLVAGALFSVILSPKGEESKIVLPKVTLAIVTNRAAPNDFINKKKLLEEKLTERFNFSSKELASRFVFQEITSANEFAAGATSLINVVVDETLSKNPEETVSSIAEVRREQLTKFLHEQQAVAGFLQSVFEDLEITPDQARKAPESILQKALIDLNLPATTPISLKLLQNRQLILISNNLPIEQKDIIRKIEEALSAKNESVSANLLLEATSMIARYLGPAADANFIGKAESLIGTLKESIKPNLSKQAFVESVRGEKVVVTLDNIFAVGNEKSHLAQLRASKRAVEKQENLKGKVQIKYVLVVSSANAALRENPDFVNEFGKENIIVRDVASVSDIRNLGVISDKPYVVITRAGKIKSYDDVKADNEFVLEVPEKAESLSGAYVAGVIVVLSNGKAEGVPGLTKKGKVFFFQPLTALLSKLMRQLEETVQAVGTAA